MTDDILISTLTALSIDYFKAPPSLTQFPPDPKRKFVLSRLTPFGANLITEVIGCSSSSPETVRNARTQYTPTQYGYNAKTASHKFIRMRLNDGIIPLDSMRDGHCAGRKDGLCSLSGFLTGVEKAEKLANYQYACFGNYSITAQEAVTGKDYDGTIFWK